MDSKTFKKLISNDPEALSNLINEYKDIAYNLAFSIVKNREDALDITQDSFLKVLENINNFRNESKLSTWLYKIVYNHSIQFSRKSKSKEFINIDLLKNSNSTKNNNDDSDKINLIHKTINELENNERIIITLFYISEKSIKDIHTITGLSPSNIKVILHRTRKKLREKLKFYHERD